ncbi:hypothetical protein SDC9_135649 [bioreactor metagenome]|uniref:Uncharacterized protein n=1 Tax=bioreactor metagenome TaxID=1076179 RepID=A0A645DH56_9ZZZZ
MQAALRIGFRNRAVVFADGFEKAVFLLNVLKVKLRKISESGSNVFVVAGRLIKLIKKAEAAAGEIAKIRIKHRRSSVRQRRIENHAPQRQIVNIAAVLDIPFIPKLGALQIFGIAGGAKIFEKPPRTGQRVADIAPRAQRRGFTNCTVVLHVIRIEYLQCAQVIDHLAAAKAVKLGIERFSGRQHRHRGERQLPVGDRSVCPAKPVYRRRKNTGAGINITITRLVVYIILRNAAGTLQPVGAQIGDRFDQFHITSGLVWQLILIYHQFLAKQC